MNQAIIASVPMAPMQMPVVRRRRVKVAEPEIKLPPRGSRGPVHISAAQSHSGDKQAP